ncbi:type II toxin-antitoxin system RelE family toxin [Streptomyces sp. SYSU K21746]
MKHRATFTPASQRDLRKIPLSDARTILRRLADLQAALDAGDTSGLDIKALTGHHARWRLRVGDYRAVYTIEEDEAGRPIIWVWVLAVGHRREIYRR